MDSSKLKQYDLNDILAADNVAELMDGEDLEYIGKEVFRGFTIDDDSRSEWKEKYQEAMKLALQVYEPKTSPWPGAANIKLPELTIACLQFNSRAYPALVTEPELVKCKVVGDDPDGQKEARAERVSQFMSYQLLDQDAGWEEDTDRLLIALPITGMIVRKTFHDSMKSMNRSEMVLPEDFCVSYFTKSLESCPRATHILHYSKREIKNRQIAGIYRDVEITPVAYQETENPQKQERMQELGYSPPSGDDPTSDRDILEQHCFMDLDGDEYEEPYVVTIEAASQKVLRIFPRFTATDIKRENDDEIRILATQGMQLMNAPLPQDDLQKKVQISVRQEQVKAIDEQIEKLKKDNRIINIDAINYFTKYPFIPSPDGGFYDIGFGSLLAPICAAADTITNQLIDAGTLQVSNVGFLGSGIRVRGGDYRFRPFEWKKTDAPSGNIKDSIVPLPVNAPSGVLLELLKLLLGYAQQIMSVTETMQGEMPGQNTPAYTMQAALDQGMKVFSGILKRLYRSFREELKKLYRLNRIYMDPQEYFTIVGTNDSAMVYRADFLGDPNAVVPEADPNIISDAQRLQKMMFLSQRSQQVPGYNPDAVEQKILKYMHISDTQDLYNIQKFPPPPNMEMQMKLAEAQRKTLETQTNAQINAYQAAAKIVNLRAQAVQFLAQASKLLGENELNHLKTEIDSLDTIHQNLMEMAGGSSGPDGNTNSGMASQSGNQTPNQIAPGAPTGIQ